MKIAGAIVIFLIIIAIVLFLTKSALFKSSPVVQNNSSRTLQSTSTKNSSRIHISSGNMPSIPFTLPNGFVIHVFASGLGNPRVMALSPDGTLLVSNPTSNKVYALPDINHDGVVDTEKVIISGENHVHGLAFYNGKLYIADVNRIVRYNWDEQTLDASFDKVLFALPDNNDHNNRTIIFDTKGTMYVSVGSTCNVCIDSSPLSATVVVSNSNGDNPRVFAKGLRNAAFLAINPTTGELWGTEMGRDYLGDNAPPDEINIIRDGKNYGWPFCYGDKIHDTNFDKRQFFQDPCANTEPPIFQIPAHSAPLGLTFIHSSQFPSNWQNDLLVSYHGSWNRTVPTGYKIVHMKVQGNTITEVDDFMTGFLQDGQTLARPVDLLFDSSGNLFISDDKAGNIFIVQKAS